MIKLNNIKVLGCSHPNIHSFDGEIECIDMVLDITYDVDLTSFDYRDFGLCEEDLTQENLRDEFASYLIVYIPGEKCCNLDSLQLEDLGFMITSDICPDVDEAFNELLEEEKIKAFKEIKEYVKTDYFKNYLENILTNN